MSLLRTLIGVGGACLFAWLLFRYSIFSLGFPLLAFFLNLIVCGWAIGLAVSGMVLRWGLGAEELAWAAVFLLAPVSGVYYPIGVLPGWLQVIAHGIPTSYVFEGMRAVLLQHEFRTDLFFSAAVNGVFMAIGVMLYLLAIAMRAARHAAADGRVATRQCSRTTSRIDLADAEPRMSSRDGPGLRDVRMRIRGEQRSAHPTARRTAGRVRRSRVAWELLMRLVCSVRHH